MEILMMISFPLKMLFLSLTFVICFFKLTVSNPVQVLSNWTENLQEYGEDYVIFESDIILPKEHVKRAVNNGSVEKPRTTDESAQDGQMQMITAPLYRRWPGGIVPYVIDEKLKCSNWFSCKLGNPERHIKSAMKKWSAKTCIVFRERTSNDRNYVHFVSSDLGNCASHIGRVGGRQNLYLGRLCRSDGTILHEIGHALGFFHEQSRPDRDEYVKINLNHVASDNWHNFAKYTNGISNMGTPYDYKSIMHYGKKAFVKPWKVFFFNSIEPKQSGKSIGQREKLSELDVKEMNLYYNCPEKEAGANK